VGSCRNSRAGCILDSVAGNTPAATGDFAGNTSAVTMSRMENAIESFVRFLAIERGLSENYQLSTQRSLSEFARWCAARKNIGHLTFACQ